MIDSLILSSSVASDGVSGVELSTDSIDSVLKLESEQEIRDLLESTLHLESQLESNLDQLLNEISLNSNTRQNSIHLFSTQSFHHSLTAIEELEELLKNNKFRAEHVSNRVRELDVLATRAQYALYTTEYILALKRIQNGLQLALSVNDIQSASNHSKEYFMLKKKKELSGKDEVVMEEDWREIAEIQSDGYEALEFIKNGIDELLRRIRQEGNEKLNALKDLSDGTEWNVLVSVEDMGEYLYKFQCVDCEEEGIEMMGNMLRICIRKETGSIMQWLDEQENEHEKAMDNGEHEAHVVALTAVFESVAGFADECEHAIVGKNEESIEQGLMILYRVLKHVQLECDELSQRIVSGYEAVRDLNRLVSNNSSSTTSFRIESRTLDPLLDEIAIFSQRTSAYFGFLTQRLSHPTLDSHDGTNTEIEELIRSSLLWKSVDRLSKHYVLLESTFMTENVQKAISMDEPPVSLSTTQTRFSSAVDDVFFVLQKCSRRAFSYASSDTLCDIIESICTCINQHLIVFIQYRITETNTFSKPNQSVQQSSSLFAEYDLSAAGSAISSLDSNTISSNAHNSASSESRFSKASYGFSIAVNNAFMCSEYALKLRVSLERDGLSLCIGTRDRSRVSAALNRLSDISTEFHSLCESAIDTLSKSLLTRISSNALNRLEQLDYVISEERYRRGEFENEDSWVNVLIREIDSKVLNGLDTKFMEIPWDLLVRNVAEWTAKKIESLILPVSLRGRRVNTLGALKFDRDIRTLNGYFSSNARRASIRDVFARLSQIALVLGLDSPSEIYDMWGPNAGVMTWRLTPSEVRRVLSLRVEFTPESIRNMKL